MVEESHVNGGQVLDVFPELRVLCSVNDNCCKTGLVPVARSGELFVLLSVLCFLQQACQGSCKRCKAFIKTERTICTHREQNAQLNVTS